MQHMQSGGTAWTVQPSFQVTDALKAAKDLGLTVIRTWAFNDGPNSSFPLQTQPGQLDARVFRWLDLLLHLACSAITCPSSIAMLHCNYSIVDPTLYAVVIWHLA